LPQNLGKGCGALSHTVLVIRDGLSHWFSPLGVACYYGFLAGVSQVMGSLVGGAKVIAHVLELVVSFGLVTVLFAMIYKFLPDVQIQWRDVWIGAALTSILFTIGKFLIGLYLGTSGVTSTFGAAGSLITVLLWVFYSALIFFLGAEFTQVYATHYGSGVVPADNAESIAAATEKRQTPPPEKRTA
jgi:membrane protein